MLVAKTKENLKECRCTECPSYTMGCKIKNYPINMIKALNNLDEVEHFEGMFCAFEKSHCIEEDRGCLCEECPIHAKYDLVREDYCIKTGGLVSRNCVEGFNRNKSH